MDIRCTPAASILILKFSTAATRSYSKSIGRLWEVSPEFDRRVRLEEQAGPTSRMAKSQQVRMQADTSHRIHCAPVGPVTDDRVSHLGQVYPNLVFATCLQSHFQSAQVR